MNDLIDLVDFPFPAHYLVVDDEDGGNSDECIISMRESPDGEPILCMRWSTKLELLL